MTYSREIIKNTVSLTVEDYANLIKHRIDLINEEMAELEIEAVRERIKSLPEVKKWTLFGIKTFKEKNSRLEYIIHRIGELWRLGYELETKYKLLKDRIGTFIISSELYYALVNTEDIYDLRRVIYDL